MGTSLTVHPFAQLPSLARREVPRLLINLERVGDLGSRPNDVVKLGDCDTIVKELCEELGWIEELNRLWDTTAETVDQNKAKGKTKRDEEALANNRGDQDAQDAKIAAQVEAISRVIQERLRIVDEHTNSALAEIAQDIDDGGDEEYDDYYVGSDSDGEPALASITSPPTNANAKTSSEEQGPTKAEAVGPEPEQPVSPINPQNAQDPLVDETGKGEGSVGKTNL
jgi:NAD-dependent histone deacetylase SIR2